MRGTICDHCEADLYGTDPNDKISLVPQDVTGLWPILLDTQEQLDFCTLDHAAAWFADVKKRRPKELKARVEADKKLTDRALGEADRRAEIIGRLTDMPDEERAFQAAGSQGQRGLRSIEQERVALIRELNEIGGLRQLGGSPPSGDAGPGSGPRGRSGKSAMRR